MGGGEGKEAALNDGCGLSHVMKRMVRPDEPEKGDVWFTRGWMEEGYEQDEQPFKEEREREGGSEE